ncbi:flagellar hook assembly protein FlgD [Insolitispirillum peregrinum]|uniref:Basal-body rod modification protein FlgD n=1 Tax=Insolitispirillum peregrinum TaxID=80876 RepID=A0A1N7KG29_9PROT|nr:flagellar hook capping FlgD N-terminal domain-containing protein [Insolitispirillum peregrinum]SIS60414.1 flagellar basal-body rod modification protein FlgD [Insolitispirillum peregrinum]
MTVSSTTLYATTDSTSTTTSSSSSTTLSADFDTFLTLLTTQLENQNPLDPMDSNEFTSQLVQYSQLEQQMATNDTLDSIYSSLNTLSINSALGYVGSEVTVSGETAPLGEGSDGIDWIYDLDSEADSVTLTISDSDGNEVWSGTGDTDEGLNYFTWDGTDSDGNAVDAGVYTLSVTATDSDGESIDTGIAFTSTVSGIDTSDGDMTLELEGEMRVTLDAVQKIET